MKVQPASQAAPAESALTAGLAGDTCDSFLYPPTPTAATFPRQPAFLLLSLPRVVARLLTSSGLSLLCLGVGAPHPGPVAHTGQLWKADVQPAVTCQH